MTKNFNLFIETFLKSFSDLPDNPPYGFWISPIGEIFSVSYWRHGSEAEDIIKKSPTDFQKEYRQSKMDAVNFLLMKKYLRVVIEEDLGEMHLDNSYYKDGMNYKKMPPTHSALKTAKDIASFYNLKYFFQN